MAMLANDSHCRGKLMWETYYCKESVPELLWASLSDVDSPLVVLFPAFPLVLRLLFTWLFLPLTAVLPAARLCFAARVRPNSIFAAATNTFTEASPPRRVFFSPWSLAEESCNKWSFFDTRGLSEVSTGRARCTLKGSRSTLWSSYTEEPDAAEDAIWRACWACRCSTTDRIYDGGSYSISASLLWNCSRVSCAEGIDLNSSVKIKKMVMNKSEANGNDHNESYVQRKVRNCSQPQHHLRVDMYSMTHHSKMRTHRFFCEVDLETHGRACRSHLGSLQSREHELLSTSPGHKYLRKTKLKMFTSQDIFVVFVSYEGTQTNERQQATAIHFIPQTKTKTK